MSRPDTCEQHLGIAISCSKIDDIHQNVIAFRQELKDGMNKAFEMEDRITTLETQKVERWRVQKWWNVTLAGGLVFMVLTLIMEWVEFHGGK